MRDYIMHIAHDHS